MRHLLPYPREKGKHGGVWAVFVRLSPREESEEHQNTSMMEKRSGATAPNSAFAAPLAALATRKRGAQSADATGAAQFGDPVC